MALRSIEGFDNLVTTNATAAVVQVPGTPYFAKGTQSIGGTISRINGWMDLSLAALSSSVSRSLGVARPLADVMTVTAKSIIYGGFKLLAQCQVYTATTLFALTDNARSLNGAVVLNWDELIAFGVPNGTECYFEWCIDGVAGLIRRRVDGKEMSTINIPAAVVTAMTNNTLNIVYGSMSSYTTRIDYPITVRVKDIYILEKLTTGTNNEWLGVQVVVPVDVDTVTGNWTPSTGTAAEVLNTNIAAGGGNSLTTPTLTSDAAATPLELKLKSSVGVAKINGVIMTVTAKKVSSNPSSIVATANLGDKSSVGKPAVLQLANTYTQTIHISDVAPDGAEWTESKLKAGSVKLELA